MRIEPERWGRDHWATFAYVEVCCVDRGGCVDPGRVQTNFNRHPLMGNPRDGAAFGIRLADSELPGGAYDEWDCLDDLEMWGLLLNTGTDTNRRYRLTEAGKIIAGQLRGRKADGNRCATFRPVWAAVPASAAPSWLLAVAQP